jgi:NAD kinase
VLGINIGHLGYLSELEVEDMEEYLKKIVEETTLMTRG